MTGHVIDFNLDGSAQAMHSDSFPLSILGAQTIERATEITFDESSQTWDICLPVSRGAVVPRVFLPIPHGTGFATYDGARKIEVQWMNECRLYGLDPDSDTGYEMLKILRERV